jgi:hypothetical protein
MVPVHLCSCGNTMLVQTQQKMPTCGHRKLATGQWTCIGALCPARDVCSSRRVPNSTSKGENRPEWVTDGNVPSKQILIIESRVFGTTIEMTSGVRGVIGDETKQTIRAAPRKMFLQFKQPRFLIYHSSRLELPSLPFTPVADPIWSHRSWPGADAERRQ